MLGQQPFGEVALTGLGGGQRTRAQQRQAIARHTISQRRAGAFAIAGLPQRERQIEPHAIGAHVGGLRSREQGHRFRALALRQKQFRKRERDVGNVRVETMRFSKRALRVGELVS